MKDPVGTILTIVIVILGLLVGYMAYYIYTAPEFKYLDNVKIIDGFYEGETGYVSDPSDIGCGFYYVKTKDGRPRVDGRLLKKIEE